MDNDNAIEVGYFRTNDKNDLDLPRLYEQNVTEEHLDFARRMHEVEGMRKVLANTYRGLLACPLCGKAVGHNLYEHMNFRWNSLYAHFIEIHGVDPDSDFAEMVKEQTGVKQPIDKSKIDNQPVPHQMLALKIHKDLIDSGRSRVKIDAAHIIQVGRWDKSCMTATDVELLKAHLRGLGVGLVELGPLKADTSFGLVSFDSFAKLPNLTMLADTFKNVGWKIPFTPR